MQRPSGGWRCSRLFDEEGPVCADSGKVRGARSARHLVPNQLLRTDEQAKAFSLLGKPVETACLSRRGVLETYRQTLFAPRGHIMSTSCSMKDKTHCKPLLSGIPCLALQLPSFAVFLHQVSQSCSSNRIVHCKQGMHRPGSLTKTS